MHRISFFKFSLPFRTCRHERSRVPTQVTIPSTREFSHRETQSHPGRLRVYGPGGFPCGSGRIRRPLLRIRRGGLRIQTQLDRICRCRLRPSISTRLPLSLRPPARLPASPTRWERRGSTRTRARRPSAGQAHLFEEAPADDLDRHALPELVPFIYPNALAHLPKSTCRRQGRTSDGRNTHIRRRTHTGGLPLPTAPADARAGARARHPLSSPSADAARPACAEQRGGCGRKQGVRSVRVCMSRPQAGARGAPSPRTSPSTYFFSFALMRLSALRLIAVPSGRSNLAGTEHEPAPRRPPARRAGGVARR